MIVGDNKGYVIVTLEYGQMCWKLSASAMLVVVHLRIGFSVDTAGRKKTECDCEFD